MQSLEDIPTWLSTTWGIDLISAQIIISVAVVLALILPVLILSKDQENSVPITLLMAWIGLALCVGLGWLPLWIMIVSIIISGLGVAVLMGNTLGGG